MDISRTWVSSNGNDCYNAFALKFRLLQRWAYGLLTFSTILICILVVCFTSQVRAQSRYPGAKRRIHDRLNRGAPAVSQRARPSPPNRAGSSTVPALERSASSREISFEQRIQAIWARGLPNVTTPARVSGVVYSRQLPSPQNHSEFAGFERAALGVQENLRRYLSDSATPRCGFLHFRLNYEGSTVYAYCRCFEPNSFVGNISNEVIARGQCSFYDRQRSRYISREEAYRMLGRPSLLADPTHLNWLDLNGHNSRVRTRGEACDTNMARGTLRKFLSTFDAPLAHLPHQ